ncbi:iron-sulfur cluster assembly scaffold protein [Patescibacteria group bacterium]|nr:iron-sulfur cluster assembly scaffold protein [Patescibacteria group bacterium]MBU1895567.1 iron-sulfur cluster assembly scaffold protein [Patescibacteria group bacterium]
MTDQEATIRGNDGTNWFYSEEVKDHFFNPRNFLHHDEKFESNAMGKVGSPACGDEMIIWLKINKDEDKIIDCRWQTFGCGSAIASTSVLSEMVKENGGMKIDTALSLKPQEITDRLGGLPIRKIHCSVLGDKALQEALNDWFRKTGQYDRIITAGKKVIDKVLNITDRDIEEAILEGARTLEDVQDKLKVGIGDPEAIPQIEDLIKFYTEKYYG